MKVSKPHTRKWIGVRQRSFACLVLGVFLLNVANVTSSHAGMVDFFNGVKLGAKLPEHDLQYLSEPPDLAGKLLLIDFWATWCAPCRESIPALNAWHAKFASSGLQIIGVSQEDRATVLPFLDALSMNYPHALDGQHSLHEALRIKGLPYAIFVNDAGTIVWRGQPSKITDALIISLLEKLQPSRDQT